MSSTWFMPLDRILYDTAGAGNSEKLAEVISRGAKVDATFYGESALHNAAYKGEAECVKVLIENGANVNALTLSGSTPLHRAVMKGSLECIIALVEANSDVNKKNDQGAIALHRAAETGQVDALEILVEAGSNVNAKKKNGWTPLHCAASKDDLNILTLLIKAGADLSITNEKNQTPFDMSESLISVWASYQFKQFTSMQDLMLQLREEMLNQNKIIASLKNAPISKELRESAGKGKKAKTDDATPKGSTSKYDQVVLEKLLELHKQVQAQTKAYNDLKAHVKVQHKAINFLRKEVYDQKHAVALLHSKIDCLTPGHMRRKIGILNAWNCSERLATSANWKQTIHGFKEITVTDSFPLDFYFIKGLFGETAGHRQINQIMAIHNEVTIAHFVETIEHLETEIALPEWQHENDIDLRNRVSMRTQSYICQTTENGAHVLWVWYAPADGDTLTICKEGFSQDMIKTGLFGDGFYTSFQAAYAAKAQANCTRLLLCNAVIKNVYPVIGTDMLKLVKNKAYKHYDAHHIPVIPQNKDDMNIDSLFLGITTASNVPTYDEFVIFEASQLLLRFIVDFDNV